jgi:hypothetical protein
MWAASAGVFKKNSLLQLQNGALSWKDGFILATETVHCGPHIPPPNRRFKRPLHMSFQKTVLLKQQGFHCTSLWFLGFCKMYLATQMCFSTQPGDHLGVWLDPIPLRNSPLPTNGTPGSCSSENLLAWGATLRAEWQPGAGSCAQLPSAGFCLHCFLRHTSSSPMPCLSELLRASFFTWNSFAGPPESLCYCKGTLSVTYSN